MAWWEPIIEFLLGILSELGYVLSVQFLNLGVLWQLLPVYTSWFAVQFITRNKEVEDVSNRFMNSFSSLWVGFQLGEYIIANFFTDPYIIFKTIIVAALFAYAIFMMRLVFLRRDITKYLARIGEVSGINIAAMLFVQDLLIISSGLQLIELIIAFIIVFTIFDFTFAYLVNYLYTKLKVPEEEEKKEEVPAPTTAPRYEQIVTPTPKPATSRPMPPTTPRPLPPTTRPLPPTQEPRPVPPVQAPIQPSNNRPPVKRVE